MEHFFVEQQKVLAIELGTWLLNGERCTQVVELFYRDKEK